MKLLFAAFIATAVTTLNFPAAFSGAFEREHVLSEPRDPQISEASLGLEHSTVA